jgi:hypothetical protein
MPSPLSIWGHGILHLVHQSLVYTAASANPVECPIVDPVEQARVVFSHASASCVRPLQQHQLKGSPPPRRPCWRGTASPQVAGTCRSPKHHAASPPPQATQRRRRCPRRRRLGAQGKAAASRARARGLFERGEEQAPVIYAHGAGMRSMQGVCIVVVYAISQLLRPPGISPSCCGAQLLWIGTSELPMLTLIWFAGSENPLRCTP